MELILNLQVATLLKADGTIEELTPKGKRKFTYEEVRDAIGNYIELIDLRYFTKNKDYKGMQFICDEEGAINGSALNENASQLLKDILGQDAQELYGNVIVMPRKLF